MKLDSDSLLQIFSYLKPLETICLALAHDRFKDLVLCHGMPANHTFSLNQTFLHNFPVDKMLWLYQAMGRNTHTVTMSNISEEDLFVLLELLPKVRHLTLENVHLTKKDKMSLVPPLESLKIDNVRGTKPCLTKLFKQLCGSLRVIDFGMDMTKPMAQAICELRDLQEVHFGGKALTMDLSTFWQRNATIQSLYIGENEVYDQKRERKREEYSSTYYSNRKQTNKNAREFCGLENLTFLSWNFYDGDFYDLGKLSALREVRLNANFYDDVCRLLESVGPQLTSLWAAWTDDVYDPIGLEKFPMLEELELTENYYYMPDDIINCKQLRILKLWDESADEVVRMIKELPLLEEIYVGKLCKWKFDTKYEASLLSVLGATDREVSINGSKFDDFKWVLLNLILFFFQKFGSKNRSGLLKVTFNISSISWRQSP